MLDNVMLPALQQPAPSRLGAGLRGRPFEADLAGGPRLDSATFADAASDTGVTVLREEVVGPYAVAIVRGTSGMRLREWLRVDGYSVPAAVEPVIDYYLGLNVNSSPCASARARGSTAWCPCASPSTGTSPACPCA